jgi:hypothetical protein
MWNRFTIFTDLFCAFTSKIYKWFQKLGPMIQMRLRMRYDIRDYLYTNSYNLYNIKSLYCSSINCLYAPCAQRSVWSNTYRYRLNFIAIKAEDLTTATSSRNFKRAVTWRRILLFSAECISVVLLLSMCKVFDTFPLTPTTSAALKIQSADTVSQTSQTHQAYVSLNTDNMCLSRWPSIRFAAVRTWKRLQNVPIRLARNL